MWLAKILRTTHRTGLLAAPITLAASAVGAQTLRFVPDMSASWASPDGRVVAGTFMHSKTGPGDHDTWSVIRWSAASGRQDWGVYSQDFATRMTAGSSDGAKLIGERDYLTSNGWTSQSIIRTASPGDVETIAAGYSYAWSAGASADGGSVAYFLGGNEGQPSSGWLARPAGKIKIGDERVPRGVSADGSTVLVTGPSFGAKLWTEPTGLIDLNIPGTRPKAMAMNQAASIIVGTTRINNADLVFRRRLDGSIKLWPMGAPGDMRSISDDGSTGVYEFADASPVRLIWRDGEIHDIVSYATSMGVNFSGWSLVKLTAMSADGRTFVGTGKYLGKQGSFVVSGVPAPGAALVLGIAALRAGRRRRCQ